MYSSQISRTSGARSGECAVPALVPAQKMWRERIQPAEMEEPECLSVRFEAAVPAAHVPLVQVPVGDVAAGVRTMACRGKRLGTKSIHF